MVVNHLQKLFVASGAATIVRELEVNHPAAKIVVKATQQQENEVSYELQIYIYCFYYYYR